MRPGWETAAGFLSARCGLMRWKGAAAPHAVSANRGVLLFFIVIFCRCLRETIEIDCSRARPQVAGAGLKSCEHGRSRWHRGAACTLGQGRPKVADRRSHCFGLLLTIAAAADRGLRHRLGLKGGASWQIDPITGLRTPCRRPPPRSAGDHRAASTRARFFVPRSRCRPAAAAAW